MNDEGNWKGGNRGKGLNVTPDVEVEGSMMSWFDECAGDGALGWMDILLRNDLFVFEFEYSCCAVSQASVIMAD